MDRRIDEAHWEENLLATVDARGHIIEFQGQIEDLTR